VTQSPFLPNRTLLPRRLTPDQNRELGALVASPLPSNTHPTANALSACVSSHMHRSLRMPA